MVDPRLVAPGPQRLFMTVKRGPLNLPILPGGARSA